MVTIVFKHGKISGDPRSLQDLLHQFEARHPNIRVRSEPLPSSTDQQHQIYAINLEGGASGMDVLAKLTPRDPSAGATLPDGDLILSVTIEER